MSLAEWRHVRTRNQLNGLISFIWLTIVGVEVHSDSKWLLTRIPLGIHHSFDGRRLNRIRVLIVH